jgi:L-cysteine S-thiosulfotransferase
MQRDLPLTLYEITLSPRGRGWPRSGRVRGSNRSQSLIAIIVTALAGAHCEASATETVLLPFQTAGDAVPGALGGLKGDARRGEEIIRDRRAGNCLICHRLPFKDEPFQGEIGPDLTGIGARLSAGQIRLRLIDESLINPQTLMPPYYRAANLNNVDPDYAGRPGLTAQQLEDVTAYLASQKE